MAQVTDALPRVQLRFVVLALALITAFFAAVGLLLYFKPGGGGEPSGEPALDIFAAGPAKDFGAGTLTYFQTEHMFLVRFSDGAFLSLYDLPPSSQAAIQDGDLTRLTCRLQVQVGDEIERMNTRRGEGRGLASTALVDPCSGTMWDTEGNHLSGPRSGDLDRFPVATIDDIVRVHLGERRCVNLVTVESPCIVTQ